jgi:hypothetical protein
VLSCPRSTIWSILPSTSPGIPVRFPWWTWHICLSAYEMRALARSSLRPRQAHEKPIALIGLHASSRARTMLFSSPARAPAVSESTLRQDELLDDRLPATHARCRPSCRSKLSPGRQSPVQPTNSSPGPTQPRSKGSAVAHGQGVGSRQGRAGALHAAAIYHPA